MKRWGAAGGLLSMEGHWNIGDKPQGLELTEAAEGDRAACTAVVDTWVGGCEKSAHGWSSRRLRCPVRRDNRGRPCRLAVKRVVGHARAGRGIRRRRSSSDFESDFTWKLCGQKKAQLVDRKRSAHRAGRGAELVFRMRRR